jgi:hypothetical protein
MFFDSTSPIVVALLLADAGKESFVSMTRNQLIFYTSHLSRTNLYSTLGETRTYFLVWLIMMA